MEGCIEKQYPTNTLHVLNEIRIYIKLTLTEKSQKMTDQVLK